MWHVHVEPAAMPPDMLCNCKACLKGRAPLVTLYSDAKLAEWVPQSMRFAVLSDGTIVVGDPNTVLHMDIMHAPHTLSLGETMICGVLNFRRGWWDVVYIQPFVPRTDENAMRLLSRLTTWADFTSGARVQWLTPEERISRWEEYFG